MFQSENIRPAHIAIDRPSPKFQAFMQKHYNLKAKINQVNNFVIYEGFFRDRPKGKQQIHWFSFSLRNLEVGTSSLSSWSVNASITAQKFAISIHNG